MSPWVFNIDLKTRIYNKNIMYRTFVKLSLSQTDLIIKNKSAPDDLKYCNMVCQDYINTSAFSKQKSICNNCRNLLNLAEKQVNESKITIEEFMENPQIV